MTVSEGRQRGSNGHEPRLKRDRRTLNFGDALLNTSQLST